MKLIRMSLYLTLFICLQVLSAQEEEDDDENISSVFWSTRALYGIKAKIGPKFTLSLWRADYMGAGPEYKVIDDPTEYMGWDITPGFSYSYGEIFGGIKLSFGSDLYILRRNQQKGTEWHQEYRPRFNLFLTKPLPWGGSIQFGQRWERRLTIGQQMKTHETIIDPETDEEILVELENPYIEDFKWFSLKRYRAMFKVTSPGFSPLKFSPYIYGESFNQPPYKLYTEWELGVNFKPYPGVSISLADNIQGNWREEYHITNHMICLYAFYTFDFSDSSIFN